MQMALLVAGTGSLIFGAWLTGTGWPLIVGGLLLLVPNLVARIRKGIG
jgi:hypothetical protein